MEATLFSSKIKYRSPLLVIFILFFVFITVVGSVGVYLSYRFYSGVVTSDSYGKGVKYNSVIAQNVLQSSAGWRGSIAISKLNGKDEYKLTFIFKGTNAPIVGASVKAHISRPVSDKYDQYTNLTDGGYGVYTAKLTIPLPGQWDISISACNGGQEFYQSKRVVLPVCK